MKVVLCTPTRDRPSQAFLDALEASVPALDAAGIEHKTVFEVGCPYISGARATMLRKAMATDADAFVFIDDDLSWRPTDLVRLIMTRGDVVAGMYRYRTEEEQYMGNICTDANGIPEVRDDGAIRAFRVPAGFLKVTRAAVEKFMLDYPELVIKNGEGVRSPDLFNHGAIGGTWYGEDMAFSKRWIEAGGLIWVVPDLQLDHHAKDRVYKGNQYDYLLRCPGGSREGQRPIWEIAP